MNKLSDEQWELFRKVSDNLPDVPEELELKLVRKIMQDPPSASFLFEGLRHDLKDKIKSLREMEKQLPHLDTNEDTKNVFKLLLFLFVKEQELTLQHLEMFEGIAYDHMELKKDVKKLLKALGNKKETNITIKNMRDKLKTQEEEMKDFKKSKPYLKFATRYFDDLQKSRENV